MSEVRVSLCLWIHQSDCVDDSDEVDEALWWWWWWWLLRMILNLYSELKYLFFSFLLCFSKCVRTYVCMYVCVWICMGIYIYVCTCD